MSHHTDGHRPLVLVPEDLPLVEAVPLAERNLPASTYELLRRTAAATPHAPALHLLGEGAPTTWTYGELLGRVHQAANLYTSLGLTPGGTVGLLLPNSGHTYAALLGAQAVGVANPVNPMLADHHVIDIFRLTRAEILVVAGPATLPGLWDKALRVAEALPGLRALLIVGGNGSNDAVHAPAQVRGGDFERLAAEQPGDRLTTSPRPEQGDLAAYFHTGGTTGTPKIAPHTHAMEVYMAWALGCSGAYADGGGVALAGLPLFHVNAVHVTGLAPFMHGAAVVSLGPLGYRDKTLMADFWHIIERYRVTAFSAVPTVYASLPPVPDGVDISSLRAGAVGAAPLPGRVRADFEQQVKVPMLEGYGLTEATCVSAATPAFAPRPGSVGLRLPYQQIKAVTDDGEDCPAGQTGVLAIKGPAVFPGYLGPDGPDPTGKISDGWLLTGDLGHVDADGYVHLTGRAKDLIIRGGHNIDPRSIEESLLSHPAVTGAAAVGRPDPHSGEVPVAYVTCSRPVSEEDLLDWARRHAPEPAAAPKAVHVLDKLPTTAVGKLFKPELLADTVRRVLTELAPDAAADVVLEDGRPIVLIGRAPDLAAALDRYAIRHRTVVIGAEVRGFLTRQAAGVLATTRPDGGIRQSTVYFALDGDRLLISTEPGRAKAKDVQRTGRASLCVVGAAAPYPSVTLEGTARIRTAGIGADTAAVWSRIGGQNVEPLSDADLAAMNRVVLEITVQRVYGASYLEDTA
ncbi:acyl-CoA synthetase [Nonomuraea sp. NPDC050556]|uniref:acyl-CoA synthetase n=1 Tax=Nonomuraea sp. NPDC050556 TaxID=3364369 RepID=UPI0037AF00F3